MTRNRRIDAYYSTGSPFSKLHLEVSCQGLQRVPVHPESLLARTTYSSLRSIGEQERLPCRMCALEPLLSDALTPRPHERTLVFATFVGHAAFSADPSRFTGKMSETAAERLERIATRLGLDIVDTVLGPATWGFFPRRGVKILERTTRTRVLNHVTEPPRPEHVQIMWTFESDNPTELGYSQAVDPWETAALLLA